MAQFAWEGRATNGDVKSGTMDAKDATEVENRLRAMAINPQKVKKKAASFEFELPFGGSVPDRSMVVFTRQMATMIDAGLPLVQCLELLGAQEPNRALQKAILGVKNSVESGSTFADALKRYPKVFDNLYVNLVAAGELGGILDTILNRLAAYIEKYTKLKAKIKGAMKYPMTILVVSTLITAGLLWKVIPTFASLFKGMGKKELPALTQALVDISNNFVAASPYIIAGCVAAYIGWKALVASKPGRRAVDGVYLRMPVVGILVRKAAVAKFTRTLGTLVSSGVPILDSLSIVAATAGNVVIEEAINYTKTKISEGKNIAAPLMETKIFPTMVVQMISVGEATGAMDVMLTKIADFYDEEVDQAVDSLTSMLEPIIMVVLGALIGSVLIGMYLPIFGMADNVGGGK